MKMLGSGDHLIGGMSLFPAPSFPSSTLLSNDPGVTSSSTWPVRLMLCLTTALAVQ